MGEGNGANQNSPQISFCVMCVFCWIGLGRRNLNIDRVLGFYFFGGGSFSLREARFIPNYDRKEAPGGGQRCRWFRRGGGHTKQLKKHRSIN